MAEANDGESIMGIPLKQLAASDVFRWSSYGLDDVFTYFIRHDPQWHKITGSTSGRRITTKALANSRFDYKEIYAALGFPDLRGKKNHTGALILPIVQDKTARKLLKMHNDLVDEKNLVTGQVVKGKKRSPVKVNGVKTPENGESSRIPKTPSSSLATPTRRAPITRRQSFGTNTATPPPPPAEREELVRARQALEEESRRGATLAADAARLMDEAEQARQAEQAYQAQAELAHQAALRETLEALEQLRQKNANKEHAIEQFRAVSRSRSNSLVHESFSSHHEDEEEYTDEGSEGYSEDVDDDDIKVETPQSVPGMFPSSSRNSAPPRQPSRRRASSSTQALPELPYAAYLTNPDSPHLDQASPQDRLASAVQGMFLSEEVMQNIQSMAMEHQQRSRK